MRDEEPQAGKRDNRAIRVQMVVHVYVDVVTPKRLALYVRLTYGTKKGDRARLKASKIGRKVDERVGIYNPELLTHGVAIMTSRVKIALLGPNRIALDGLQRILAENGFEITHSSNNATALSEALNSQIPDPDSVWILLVYGPADANKSYDPGELVERFPSLRCAILADFFDFDEMVKCFREGVRGYIIAASSQALVISLQLIAIGEKVMPSTLAEFLPMHPSVGPSPGKSHSIEEAGLSTRELEILACLVSGHPNKIISRQLEISEATVKVHVKAILRKIGVQNRTQAAIWAVGERLGDDLLHPAHCLKAANGADHGSPLN